MTLRYRRVMSSYKKVGGFLPTDIAGCELWIDFSDASTLFTDAGSTPISSDGDLIYQANDKSGNGYNATQETEGARPLYKVGVKNGLSIAKFDGTDDRMAAGLGGKFKGLEIGAH